MSSVYNARLKNYEPNPSAIWLHAYDTLPGDIELSGATWDSVHSHISHIIIKTKSTNWDMYICEEQEEEDATVGTTMVWGQNNAGQIGDGTLLARLTPTQIIGDHKFVHIAKGNYNSSFTCALKGDGSAWTWGSNAYGQLGDGTVINKSSPVSVIGEHSFVQVSVGDSHVIALKEDGTAWAWGNNSYYALGIGNTNHQSSPIMITCEHQFKNITAGFNFSIGLDINDSVYAWGHNSYGQLGNGTIIHRSTPTAVIGNHKFISISCGNYFTQALKKNGTIWAWGNGTNGRLGYGGTTSVSSPVSVIGGHSFIHALGGGSFSIALKKDGSVWTWGKNIYGSLGDGTTEDKYSPVAVIGNHSFIYITGGTESGYAIKKDGSGWSWGANHSGQLGNNSTTNSTSPNLIIGDYKFSKIAGYSNYAAGILAKPVSKITTTKIATNKIGDACIQINSSFNSSTNRIFLKYVDKSGHNPCDIYLLGEKRGGIKKCKPSVYAEPEQSHPLMQDISGLWLFNEGSGSTVHDYSGNNWDGEVVRTPIWETGPYGPTQRAYRAKLTTLPNIAIASDPVTMYSRFYLRSAHATDGRYLIGCAYVDVVVKYSNSMVIQSNIGRLYGYIGGNSTTVSGISLDAWHTGICVGTGTTMSLYLDGLLVDSGTSGSADPIAPWRIASRSAASDGSGEGATYPEYTDEAAIWSRALSAEEIAYLHEHPWCMFKGHSGY